MRKNLLLSTAAMLLILLFRAPAGFSQAVVLPDDKIVDNEALVYSTNAYGYYPSIQSFSQPPVITYNNYQYVTYYNKDQRVCVGRRSLPAGSWETMAFTDYLFSTIDCHNVPVLGISADGKIHLSFDHHVSTFKYRVSVAGVANNPGSFTWNTSLFGAITDTLPGMTVPQTAVTYPAFMATPSGKLQLVMRIGNSGNGKERLFEYDTTTANWTDLGWFTSSAGIYTGPITDGQHRNIYRDGIGYYGGSRLHMLFSWRETGDVQSQHDILYAYSDDEGRTWKNSANTSFATTGTDLIGLADTAAIIYRLGQKHGLLNQEYMHVDKQGRIHAFKKHMLATEADASSWDDAKSKSKAYHHMRATNGTWTTSLLPFNTYRANFVADSSGILYAVTGDKLDVWAATPASGYTDWALIHRFDSVARYAEETILIDKERMINDNILSVLVQEKYTASGQPSKIHTIDFTLSAEPSITLDNTTAEITGSWNTSTAITNYYGVNYRVRASGGTGLNSVKWRATIPSAGDYAVYVWLPDGLPNRATNAKYVVYHSGYNTTYYVDQSLPGGRWVLLGTHTMTTNNTGNGVVMLTDEGNNDYVIADAVRFVKQPSGSARKSAPLVYPQKPESITRELRFWANPSGEVRGTFYAAAPTTGNIMIVDLLGRVLLQKNIKVEQGYNTFSMGTEGMPRGLLLAVLSTGPERRTLKFIKY